MEKPFFLFGRPTYPRHYASFCFQPQLYKPPRSTITVNGILTGWFASQRKNTIKRLAALCGRPPASLRRRTGRMEPAPRGRRSVADGWHESSQSEPMQKLVADGPKPGASTEKDRIGPRLCVLISDVFF